MHAYTWKDVKSVPADALSVGDVLVKPGVGTAYRTASNGTVRGVGWTDLDGTAWTVIAREGGTVTARDEDGREASESIPKGAHVLRVIALGGE